MKLSNVIEEIVEERGLDRIQLGAVICEGILAAYQRKYPELTFKVEYNPKSDEICIEIQKVVVGSSTEADAEISLRKARFLDKDIEVGSSVWVPFEGKIGRIEILRAKQFIAGKIRDIEAEAIYAEFKDKEGSIVHGTIHKCERGGASVRLQQEGMAFLPKSLSIPDDKCVVGMPIRALLKEVLREPRSENQLILDRSSSDFLKKLFELEIPEVFERLVEIKNIVRIPGYKSKVVVVSNDLNIDPVGTCIGVGGVRIKPILKELNNEKIDVISHSDSLEEMIRLALKPAEIGRVEVLDSHNANVWLEEDQRSLAIGRMGQNISLASRLVGVNIHLVQGGDGKSKKPDVVQDLD